MGKRKVEDLTGQQFGRLKVIEYAGQNSHRVSMWLCECQCDKHTRKIICSSALKSGATKSCGCLNREVSRERFKKNNPNFKGQNNYEQKENYVYGYDDKGNHFIIDAKDFNKVKDYRWYLNDSGYWIAQMYPGGERKLVRMHRYLLNAQDDQIIDHKNRNPSDNRRSNLRFCTSQENSMNNSLVETSKSGVTGVNYYKASDCWEVHIGYKGKSIYLGHYSNLEDAIKARLKAEKELFKDFAPQKELFEKYGIN